MSENGKNAETTKPYIVKDANGVEYLIPTYPATFRALMDDKDTIRDLLNSLLELDRDHEIVDLTTNSKSTSMCSCPATNR